MKAKTKEEKFLVALFELAQKETGVDVSRYAVGKKLGIHPKGIDTICNQLAQANFIRKSGKEFVSLTSNGESLVQQLIGTS